MPTLPASGQPRPAHRIIPKAIVLAVGVAAWTVLPQPLQAEPWTIQRVLRAVRLGDPGITAARSAGRAGRADGAAGASALSPRVTLDAGATRSDDPGLLFSQKLWQGRFTAQDFALPSFNKPPARSAWNWGVTVEQPLWNGGSEVTAPRLAAQRRRAATGMERARVADRLLYAVETFSNSVRARDALAADSTALAAALEQRRAAVERFRLGQVPELDTLRATARWAEARATWLTARKDLLLALARLSQLVGEGVAVTDLGGIPDPAAIAEDAGAGTGPERGDLEAARARARALGIESTRATLLLLPSLNARLDYRDYRDPDSGEGDRRFLAALSVSLPIWDGLERIEKRRAARARAEEARAQAELLRRAVDLEIEDARSEASISLERRDAARIQRAASEEALRLALARYRAGLLPQTDLLAADADAARARLNGVSAEIDAVIAQYRYRHATGVLE
jgi:outer membrane protein